MKRTFICAVCALAFPLLVQAAEPGWNSVKDILRKEFPNKVNCPAEDIIKLEDAKDSSYWVNREYYPPVNMFSYAGWVYYKGELPGEVRRQKIIANYEQIAGNWQYKHCGVPVSGGNDQVTPPTKLPPLPTPPAIGVFKDKYMADLKKKYSDGGAEILDLKLDTFETPAKLEHVKNDDGGYATVLFEATAKIKYAAKVNDHGRVQMITGEGPAKLSASATKDPASQWFQSTDVKDWNLVILEEPTSFAINYEYVGQSSSSGTEDKTKSMLKGKLKGFLR